jgi:DNA-binding GntR family transcriptional regulator
MINPAPQQIRPRQIDLSHAPLNEQIYQQLRWDLTVGNYRPGNKLSIRRLAKALGTSAMPVREALKRLVSERALEVFGNRSFAVPIFEPKRVSDLVFIRSSLEGIATQLATETLTRRQIDRLSELAMLMDRDVNGADTTGYLTRNYNFHFTIYTAAGNSDLVSIIEGLWAQTGPFLAAVVRKVEMSGDCRRLHGRIAEAIRVRDAAEARALIEKDISWGTLYFHELAEGHAHSKKPDIG